MASVSVSVIVPALGNEGDLAACLAGLRDQTEPAEELIVVDDGTEPPLRLDGVTTLRRETCGGPARARNDGAAAARGEVLLFLDADVVPAPELLARTRRAFSADAAPDAVFGTYAPRRTDRGLVSDWKDLSIAGLHASAPREAASFWSACGAVRREVFRAMGGFDAERFPRATVEDLDLGLRMRDAGRRIECRPELEVVHRKRWSLGRVVRSDVFDRAIPWSRLLHARRVRSDALHLRPGRKIAALSLWGALLSLTLAPVTPTAAGVAALFLLVAGLASRREIAWFVRCGGAGFAVGATLLHALYLLYSSAAFALTRLFPVTPPSPSPSQSPSPSGSRAPGE